MPELPDRDLREAALSAAVGAELARFLRVALRSIPELQGSFDNLTPAEYDEHVAKLTAAIAPQLQQTYTEAAANLMTELPYLDIEWGLFNQAAVNWAQSYTFDLVQGLTRTSENVLRAAIGQYFEQGLSQKELRDALQSTFGPRRARLIAVTETTRAAVEGESETVRRLEEDDNIMMRPIHQTRFDERVCPICGPRNEKEIRPDNETQGQYPPVHPGCRCSVRHEIIE